MPKYKVLRGFCLGDGQDVYPGAVIELPENVALPRVQMGKLSPVGAERVIEVTETGEGDAGSKED